MKVLLAFLGCCALSCQSQKRPEAPPDLVRLLNKERSQANVILCGNGFYENAAPQKIKTTSKGKYYAADPLYFYGNNVVLYQRGLAADSAGYADYFLRSDPAKGDLARHSGAYEISRDTLKVILIRLFNNNHSQKYKYGICYYQGIIKNKDSIVDWKMVAPFPPFSEEFNHIEKEKIPSTLIFRSFPAKNRLDSNKVWVNDYKTSPGTIKK